MTIDVISTFCSSSLWTCLHHMVILRNQNKITDFLMILALASPFKALNLFDVLEYYTIPSSILRTNYMANKYFKGLGLMSNYRISF